ncbi:MAG: hypothetical protein IPJ24_16640 [bacterium]|nr:hypothetical protein [bacterium]
MFGPRFRTGSERLREDHVDTELADASHTIDGILVLNGPGVRAGTPDHRRDIYDIAPTRLPHCWPARVAGDLSPAAGSRRRR